LDDLIGGSTKNLKIGRQRQPPIPSTRAAPTYAAQQGFTLARTPGEVAEWLKALAC
jgi:hypothetical protein